MAGFYAVGWQIALLICCVAALAYAQRSICEPSYSENAGMVTLCTTLAPTFRGSERVAVSSADTSASVGQDYLLLDSEVQVIFDQTGRLTACTRLQIISDEDSEGSEFFNLTFIQPSSRTVEAFCLVEITDGVSVFPFLECQESQLIAEEGGVAEVCFVLRNAETLQRQTIITANVFLQEVGTANVSMDYNLSSTRFDVRAGITEVACVSISIHRDGAPERVENFYVAAIPNGMIGTPVGGDSCEVLIIDGDGPDVECPGQFNRTVGSFGYVVQPGARGDAPFLQELYGDEFCFDPTVDIYTPVELCSSSGIFVGDCTQWNTNSFHETLQSQSFREYVPLLTETSSDNICLMQVRMRLTRLYGRRTAADMRISCTTNCVMSVVQNDCIGVDFLLQGVSLQSVADLLLDFPLDHDNCYVNLTCCETQVPVECTEATEPTGTQTPSTLSNSGNRGNSSIVDGVSVGVAVGASIGGVLIVILVVLSVVLVVVLLYYHSRKRSQVYKPQISGGEVESREPAPEASQSALSDPVYHEPQVVTGNADQGVYEEIILHIGKFDQYGKWRQVFEGKVIDQSHLEVGDYLGEGAFGKVYKGILWSDTKPPSSKQVAIKTLKKASSREEIEDFMAEPALMQDFDHCNVLGLLGICFDTQNHIPLIVLPYMENGDLRSFLKSKRLTDKQTSRATFPEGLSEPILMGMCLDVAVGMQYLAAHKFVHRDLSARNCMVDFQLQVRVADFGLSRDICNSDYYRLMHNARLPVKWMSPESLYDNIYTEKTDVWSFGVVCWEVFSLGRKPYPGVANMDIPDYISNGHCLKKPTLCPDNLYESMLSTWQYHPEDRPTFDELVKLVVSFYEPEDTAEHQYFVLENSRKEPFCADSNAYDGGDAEDPNAHLYTDVDFDCAHEKPSYMNVSRSVQSSLIELLSRENSQQNTEPLQYEIPVSTASPSSPCQLTDQQTTVPMEYEVPTTTTTLSSVTTPLPNDLPSNPDGHLYHILESHM